MPRRMPYQRPRSTFKDKIFHTTGMSVGGLVKLVIVLAIAAGGIAFIVLEEGAQKSSPDDRPVTMVDPKRKTSEQKYMEVSLMPADFNKKRPVERIEIVLAKIKSCEELVRGGGQYADRATDQLVNLYGIYCELQDSAGLDAEKSYSRLSQLRQQAAEVGNEQRVAKADFLRAYAATARLRKYDEKSDFRFAADAVLNLESKNLVNVKELNKLYSVATLLHDEASEKDNSTIFLSLLADKLIESAVTPISNLGLNLKDYPVYSRFYAAIDKRAFTTRESKFELFRNLFATIEKNPPQSPRTYETTLRFFDDLLNQSDAKYAGVLSLRLTKAASMVSPKIKAYVERAISNIGRRVATIGKPMDLAGAKWDGTALVLPNENPTVLVFWSSDNTKSTNYIKELARSDRFDPWATNILLASVTELTDEELKKYSIAMRKFTFLDYATSQKMMQQLGIDRVPYMVTMDKSGSPIRFGDAAYSR